MTLHWHTEPFLLILLIGIVWLYGLWVWPLRKACGVSEPIPWRYPILFYLGVLVVYAAVGSPIDQIGETYLFSVHMFQHLLLIYLAPILMVLGLPPHLVDATVRSRPAAKSLLKLYLHPAIAAASFTLILSLWHVPALYESALRSKPIHMLEHFSIMVPAFALFWIALSRSKELPPLSPPGRMLLIFILMVGQTPLFGVLSFSDVVLYPTYEWAPRITNLSALEDQILGGVLMKVGGMLVAMPLFALAFFSWVRSQEKEDEPSSEGSHAQQKLANECKFHAAK